MSMCASIPQIMFMKGKAAVCIVRYVRSCLFHSTFSMLTFIVYMTNDSHNSLV